MTLHKKKEKDAAKREIEQSDFQRVVRYFLGSKIDRGSDERPKERGAASEKAPAEIKKRS